jgi:hypothetical protein
MFGWLFDRKAQIDVAAADRKSMASERRRPPAGISTKLADQEDKWNAIADAVGFVVAVYAKNEETRVDVLRVDGAYLNDRHTLVLQVVAPQTSSDRHIGDRIQWVREFELPIEDLLHYEPLRAEFGRVDAETYRSAVERGLRAAEKL